VPEFRIWEIQEHHLAGKPLAYRMLNIELCSTMSKAFSKSSFRIIISLLEV
jgi:hypothetical protein